MAYNAAPGSFENEALSINNNNDYYEPVYSPTNFTYGEFLPTCPSPQMNSPPPLLYGTNSQNLRLFTPALTDYNVFDPYNRMQHCAMHTSPLNRCNLKSNFKRKIRDDFTWEGIPALKQKRNEEKMIADMGQLSLSASSSPASSGFEQEKSRLCRFVVGHDKESSDKSNGRVRRDSYQRKRDLRSFREIEQSLLDDSDEDRDMCNDNGDERSATVVFSDELKELHNRCKNDAIVLSLQNPIPIIQNPSKSMALTLWHPPSGLVETIRQQLGQGACKSSNPVTDLTMECSSTSATAASSPAPSGVADITDDLMDL